MKEYPNFFENFQEFCRRLQNTVVTYDGEPYTIINVGTHKPDGIFRVYLWPSKNGPCAPGNKNYPPVFGEYAAYTNEFSNSLDTWLKGAGKESGILRKQANSPAFNKYRPFPLGMMNKNGQVYYLSRQPSRHIEQGLTGNGLVVTPVGFQSGSSGTPVGRNSLGFMQTPEFHDCVTGAHPSLVDCVTNLLDPEIQNESVAFHREFAILRGPVNTLFLAYKNEVVGLVRNKDNPEVVLSHKYSYLREIVEKTGSFSSINIE